MVSFLHRLELYISQADVRTRRVVAARQVHRCHRSQIRPATRIISMQLLIKWNCEELGGYVYLPGLDSDAGHRVAHDDILHCDVGDACFGVVPPEPSDADPMAWPTVHVVYVDISASGLDRDAVVACVITVRKLGISESRRWRSKAAKERNMWTNERIELLSNGGYWNYHSPSCCDGWRHLWSSASVFRRC